jgi:multiple sugar transport system permease protein
MIVAFTIIAYPLLYTLFLSVNHLNLRTSSMSFVGLENFEAVFASPHFPDVVRQTLTWTAGSVILQVIVGMLVALTLNRIHRWRGLLGAILLIPWVSSFVVSAAIWRWILHPELGALAAPMQAIGLGGFISNWNSDPSLAMFTMVAINTWKWFPFVAVMLLAGMQTIQQELYESAMLDGANLFQKFWYITLPGLRVALLSVAILTTTWALNGFTLIWLITGGAPAGATDIISILIYKLGFIGFGFGQAAAASTVLFTMVILVTIFYLRAFGEEEVA